MKMSYFSSIPILTLATALIGTGCDRNFIEADSSNKAKELEAITTSSHVRLIFTEDNGERLLSKVITTEPGTYTISIGYMSETARRHATWVSSCSFSSSPATTTKNPFVYSPDIEPLSNSRCTLAEVILDNENAHPVKERVFLQDSFEHHEALPLPARRAAHE